MTVRVGINGFGRIGRSVARVLIDREPLVGIELVAVNDPNADKDTLAFLLAHDSIAGRLGVDVQTTETGLRVGSHEIAVTVSTVNRWENAHAEPSKLAWKAIQDLARKRGVPDDIARHAGLSEN